MNEMTYQNQLYESYSVDRARYHNEKKHREFLAKYMDINYSRFLPVKRNGAVKVLEIGCNNGKGYAYLQKNYSDIDYTGIDLSPVDVQTAVQNTGEKIFFVEDAFDYLPNHKENFDLIIMRAVLEHIEKGRVMELLYLIKNSLVGGGYCNYRCSQYGLVLERA